MGCLTYSRKSFEAPRSLSNKRRGDSQENGFLGILAAALLLTTLVIYLFGWDTVMSWISRLTGAIL